MKKQKFSAGKAPLYEAVLCLCEKDRVRFHMPGHGGAAAEELFLSAKFDLTELEGLDDLHSPCGAIAEAEELLAKAYGCERAHLFTTGSTGCMHAALALARTRGEILYTGEMHKSFFGGLRLLGLSAEFVPEERLEERLKRGAGSLFSPLPTISEKLSAAKKKSAFAGNTAF